MGTNDQPGDYRNSGCASCHVVYANDRDPKHSGAYAQYGHSGQSVTADPVIDRQEKGHPLHHAFTRSVPTSQCMICHMHQPNMFMNTYMGYTMWDYESDAPLMWPKKQRYPSDEEMREINERNPEGAAVRGKWGDPDFLDHVSELNDKTQGHPVRRLSRPRLELPRGVQARPRGQPAGCQGQGRQRRRSSQVRQGRAHVVHPHGRGHALRGLPLLARTITATATSTVRWPTRWRSTAPTVTARSTKYPNLYTSGAAALGGGTDFSLLRTPDGRKRFEWNGGELYQRSMMDPKLEWRLSLVKDSVDPANPHYNAKAARAKLMSRNTAVRTGARTCRPISAPTPTTTWSATRCHTSWTTSCGGCHLPIEANWKTERHHYEGGETRNFATYNPQVARDQMFLIGRRGPANDSKIAPVRSSSALVLSSTNANREHIYVQQPPIAASGFSSQAFNPHFPHTVRKTETKTCTDCHLSRENDNNAIMAQLLMLGTNFVNFVGYHAYVGGDGEFDAVQVTEWDEPQAVIGSYLQKYAYPDWYKQHQENGRRLQHGYSHGAGTVGCLQLRGEYLYTAGGEDGMRVYDVSSVGNKGFSERVITAPFSPLGHDTHVASKDATCIALPTNQPIHPPRNQGELMRVDNQEQPFHPIYNYAVVTDASEGLILVNVDTLADGEPRNNFLSRAATWNENGVLDGARHVTLGGHYAYVVADAGLVIVDLDDPLQPKLVATVPLNHGRASALQFRYLFVTDADGLKAIDVTDPHAPKLVQNDTIALADAHRVYVARTYAYVAAGRDGLAIVDVTRPESMRELTRFNAGGQLVDSRDVVVATTNASLFAYVADGKGGLKVLQLTSPEIQPKFYGFSPEPHPELIASYPTSRPALSLSKGLDRDRGVDESGDQIAVFGRRGARPLNLEEMQQLYMNADGKPWFVTDETGQSAGADQGAAR